MESYPSNPSLWARPHKWLCGCQSLKYIGFCSLFGNVQELCLLVMLFSIPHPQPKSDVSMNKKMWLLFVFPSPSLSELSGQTKRPGGLLDALDDIWEGYMASAGKTTANIGIIKSDLHAIITSVTVKRGHREAGDLYDRGSILP